LYLKMASSSSKVDYEVTVEWENLLRIAHANTSYCEDHKQEGKRIFHQLITRCQSLEDETSQKIIDKFEPLAASTAAQRNQYRAMIKVAWRFVRSSKTGDAMEVLALLVIAFASLTNGARKSGAKVVRVDKWRDEIARWLGRQLTIGGQGVTGEPVGNPLDRVQQFLSTPYLHDFD